MTIRFSLRRSAGARRVCRWLLPVLAVGCAAPVGAQTFDLDWHTFDSGGGQSAGGGYVLSGTIGQPESGAVPSAGGLYALAGGLWLGLEGGDAGVIFSDGFESGDLSAWSTVVGMKRAGGGVSAPGSQPQQEVNRSPGWLPRVARRWEPGPTL